MHVGRFTLLAFSRGCVVYEQLWRLNGWVEDYRQRLFFTKLMVQSMGFHHPWPHVIDNWFLCKKQKFSQGLRYLTMEGLGCIPGAINRISMWDLAEWPDERLCGCLRWLNGWRQPFTSSLPGATIYTTWKILLNITGLVRLSAPQG